MGSLQQMANSAGCADTAAKISRDLVEEQHLQRKIIDAMGQFTANLPDYSKNDVVMFIARQINSQQFTYLDAAIANQQQQVLFLLKTEWFLFKYLFGCVCVCVNSLHRHLKMNNEKSNLDHFEIIVAHLQTKKYDF